jgi:O-acetylhomoserine (thiol)-lyase
MTEPYEGFHNLVFAEEFGPQAFITRARKEGIRDFGACMAPMTAFQILQGLETLPLRMQKHVSNTEEVVAYLQAHPLVDSVIYPGLQTHPDYALAQELLPKGAGAVFTFTVKGGREAGRIFIEALELFSHLANIGDAKSLVIHPASTTHHRMDAASLKAAGIGEGLVRVSVGLEDPADLIADLKSALRAVEKAS